MLYTTDVLSLPRWHAESRKISWPMSFTSAKA